MAGQLAPDTQGPSPAAWRAAMGCFPTGVTIVTSWRGDEPVGSTVNAFCSVSLTPPMLLVCLDKANPILEPVRASGVFGVNILAHGGEGLARRFAVLPEEGRFADLGFHAPADGAPRLAVSPVFIDCAVHAMHEAGDHYVVIGLGRHIDHDDHAGPLLFHVGGFRSL